MSYKRYRFTWICCLCAPLIKCHRHIVAKVIYSLLSDTFISFTIDFLTNMQTHQLASIHTQLSGVYEKSVNHFRVLLKCYTTFDTTMYRQINWCMYVYLSQFIFYRLVVVNFECEWWRNCICSHLESDWLVFFSCNTIYINHKRKLLAIWKSMINHYNQTYLSTSFYFSCYKYFQILIRSSFGHGLISNLIWILCSLCGLLELS